MKNGGSALPPAIHLWITPSGTYQMLGKGIVRTQYLGVKLAETGDKCLSRNPASQRYLRVIFGDRAVAGKGSDVSKTGPQNGSPTLT